MSPEVRAIVSILGIRAGCRRTPGQVKSMNRTSELSSTNVGRWSSRRGLRWLVILVIIPVALLAGYTWVTLNFV